MTDHLYTYAATCSRVIDGDTLELDVDLGFGIVKRDRFRLLGIDTPETHGRKKGSLEYEHGKQATEMVVGLVFSGPTSEEWNRQPLTIHTHKDKQGKYGRYLIEVTLEDGRDLAAVLREAGMEKRESYD